MKQGVIESLLVYPLVQDTFPTFSSAEKKTFLELLTQSETTELQ